jgi:predicted secreted protein
MMRHLTAALAALVLLGAAAGARAELCNECKKYAFIQSVGKCEVCGKETTSGAMRLCPACSVRLRQCEHCRVALGPAAEAPAPVAAAQPPAATEWPAMITVTEADDGQTRYLPIGSGLEVRLKGTATTGYRWVELAGAGDALTKTHGPDYVSGGFGGVVGGGGAFVTRYQAVKVGRTEVRLGYRRLWDIARPASKTFTLKVEVVADPAPDRVQRLKSDLANFRLNLRYYGEKEKDFHALSLSGTRHKLVLGAPKDLAAQVSDAEAARIVDYLSGAGWLGRAIDTSKAKFSDPEGPCYVLTVSGGDRAKAVTYVGDLGWGKEMYARLRSLRGVLGGDAAAKMDQLLAHLAGLHETWK